MDSLLEKRSEAWPSNDLHCHSATRPFTAREAGVGGAMEGAGGGGEGVVEGGGLSSCLVNQPS